MELSNLFIKGKKRRQIDQRLKIVLSLFFISIILLNILNNNFSGENFSAENRDILDNPIDNLQTSSATSMLQDPFTENFDLLRDFFETKYQSSLDFEIPTYFRYGDSDGVITDDTIFSEDNLFYYNSLMKMEIDDLETFDIFLDLIGTTLWYEGDVNEFEYGFVKSIDNTTGEIKDSNRYLYDNLLPIFLLIENIGAEINTISINGKSPRYYINEMFYLMNSSEFWDDRINYNGFYHYNSSYLEPPLNINVKYSESNFYAILANLLIHQTYYDLNLDATIRNRAYELANLTMIDMINNMWDSDDEAFYHNADRNWGTGGGQQTNYYLSTNALGIISLIELWIESGMQNDSTYLLMAIDLYESLSDETHLWDSSNNLYRNIAQPTWAPFDSSLNIDSNALMMRACLKLFEGTGNITYYNRALKLYNSLERLYDDINGAYNLSLGDTSKSFYSNLKLSKAHLDAFDIYNSTVLTGVYNVSENVPDFIFNQEKMNLTSTYSFIKNIPFYNPENESYGRSIVQYDITNATVNYVFKYPNGTFYYQFEDQINEPVTSSTLLYNITETLPIGDGYYTYIWANTTYFRLTNTLTRFNVVSGLINKSIEGLPSTLYQGPVINVSLVINYTRYENLTLTASLEGEDLQKYPSQEISFVTLEEIRINFNLTAKLGAIPGSSEIFFIIKKDDIIYLEINKVIEIGYPFDYSNLIYQSKVVSGDSIFVSMNLKNFLLNATQTFNVSFIGYNDNYIEEFVEEETLDENEIKSVSYYLKTLESIDIETIRIKMSILINTTEFYSEIFSVEILPKFELISATFPNTIPQGANAHLIIVIQNNQENPEEFSLYFNGKRVSTNIAELNTGVNTIVAKITPTINPYEFGTKVYRIVLKDSSDEEIERFYFETALKLSSLNLVIFYILPIVVPIGVILFFKNRDIKQKKLRR